MKAFQQKKWNNKGFTLMEMLLTVGIICVLAAVIVLSLTSVRKNLRQTELDSKAEIIYTAAQNRIAELKASGRAQVYAEDAQGVREVGYTPIDADSTEIKDDTLYYVVANSFTSSSAATEILPPTSTDLSLISNYWIVEYNPASGSVYAVFYSETPFSYSDDSLDNLRNKSQRIKGGAKIGYYGGDQVQGDSTATLQPTIEIDNAEKLTVTFSCNTLGNGSTLHFYITVTDDQGHKKEVDVNSAKLTRVGKTYKYIWVMDDLSSDALHFSKQFPTLTPGSDITISLRVTSDNAQVDEKTVSAKTNSLFAYDTSENDHTAVVMWGRQLQNLNPDTSAVTDSITGVVQKNDITFTDVEDKTNDWYSVYNNMTFEPINNAAIQSYTGSYFTVSGEEVRTAIYGLHTTKANNTGMFGTFYGNTLKNIKLVGTTVEANTRAGAIAGITSNDVVLSGCMVYLSAVNGDLTGKTADDVWLSGLNVGGLVGYATGKVSISNCMAATVIDAKSYGGGLLGYADETVTISNSYADNYITGKDTGGLVGYAKGTTQVSSCYATGYQISQKSAAGLVNSAASIENAYAAMSYTATGNLTVYTTAKSGNATNVYYLTSGLSNPKNLANTTGLNYHDLSNRTTMAQRLGDSFTDSTGGSNTSAYNLMDQGLSYYSYPKLSSLPHYGDWQAEFESGVLVYFEAYADGTYGFYGASKSALSNNKTITGDGYAVVYADKPDTDLSITYAADHNGATAQVSAAASSAIPITTSGETYYLICLPKEVVNTPYAPTAFYQPITVNDTLYYYNPHFAKTVTVDTVTPGVPDLVTVRTPRQLFSMSLYYSYGYASGVAHCNFIQEADIDYTAYNWSTWYRTDTAAISMQTPIGNDGTMPFKASYNGNSHVITGVSLRSSGSCTGLFGYNSGIIKNVIVQADYSTGTDADNYVISHTGIISGRGTSVYMGVLTGYNSGSISNCAVAGYGASVYAYKNSTIYLGSIAGMNAGVIYNSAADCPSLQAETTYSNAYLGGFVGNNSGAISNAYGLSSIQVRQFKSGNVSLGGFAAANTGVIQSSYCATALTASGNTSAYGFTSTGGVISKCYYLNEGTYSYLDELHAYNNTGGASSATGVTLEELAQLNLSGFGSASAENTFAHANTATGTTAYPFPSVVKNSAGNYVHFGEWIESADLGALGVFYWEYEQGGSNSGYHFSYIGTYNNNRTSASTLCTAHDDNGVITSYGYGYYCKEGEENYIQTSESGFTKGSVNQEASQAIEQQMKGYSFTAYTTGTPGNGNSVMYLTSTAYNGTWTLQYLGYRYQFIINPFFGNAISYHYSSVTNSYTGEAVPGSTGNSYEIRSAKQLQYINWNSNTKNENTVVASTNTTQLTRFTYLAYFYGGSSFFTPTNDYSSKNNFNWNQSHDVNANGVTGQSNTYFTPIGGLYDSAKNSSASCYVACFSSNYDGNDYVIRNIEIHSTSQCVGLFGITLGADLSNIVLYSDSGNEIATASSGTNWYCLGGLVGMAAQGSTTGQITNCSTSGYVIHDVRGTGGSETGIGYGGAGIGGLVGICNMSFSGCTAANTLSLEFRHSYGGRYVRVGGLVGSCRNTIKNCYAGGTIELGNSVKNSSTHLCLGGLFGGTFMKDTGNLQKIVGTGTQDFWGTPECDAYNCYSYTTLPTLVHTDSSCTCEAIGGSADRGSVTLNNCYYLDSAYPTISSDNSGRFSGNSTQALDYGQMSDTKTTDGMLYRLNQGYGSVAGNFGIITTEEGGADISGKYSFPGNDVQLEGKNYPFPTILHQQDSLGRTVNVHYGTWPKVGLFWENESAEIDLISDSDAAGVAQISQKLYLKDVSNSGSLTLTCDDDTIVLAEEVGYDTNGQYYQVNITGLSPGTATVTAVYTAGGKEYTSDLSVDVTAQMTLKADPMIVQTYIDESTPITLTALSKPDADGNSIDLTPLVTWKAVSDDENVASCDLKKNGKLTITGVDQGDTLVRVTGSYISNGKTYSQSVLISITVQKQGVIGLANTQQPLFNEVLMPKSQPLGAYAGTDNTSYTEGNKPNLADETLFLYATGTNVSLGDFTISQIQVTDALGVTTTVYDESGTTSDLFTITVGTEVTADSNFEYLPITFQTSQTDAPFTLTVTLNHSGAQYTLTVSNVQSGT